MSLQRKGEKWLEISIKSIAVFAALGLIVLLVAVHFVEKTITDVINASTGTSAPANTSTSDAKQKRGL